MTEISPLLRRNPDAHRTLYDRIIDIFRTLSSSNVAPVTGYDDSDGQDGQRPRDTISSDPDARARLLESYEQSNPVCGERRCSHGTFSPRLEEPERHTYLGKSNGVFDEYGGIPNTVTASSHFSGSDGDQPPGSHLDLEYTPQMKSSLTALSINGHNKLYVTLHEYPRRQIHITFRKPYLLTLFSQICLLLHSFLQLDRSIPLGFLAR